jgi:hypothetical protein
MVDLISPIMHPGRVVATPGALEALAAAQEFAGHFIARHLAGDWGDNGTYAKTEVTEKERRYGAMATDDDAKLNRLAVEADNGSRVMSSYTLIDGTRLWVVTEGIGADRHTCVLLPSEY